MTDTPGTQDTPDVVSTAEEIEHADTEQADTEQADTEQVEATDPAPEVATPAGRSGGLRAALIPAVLAVLLLASAAFTSWIYFSQYRPDAQTNSAVAGTALQAANDGTVSLLSYTPDTLDEDFANAKSHLTGDFLNYYTQFTNDIVTPAAKQKKVKTSATVVRSAVSDLQPDTATVLVFINQNTTSSENPDGSFTASAVKVGLVKTGDAWLISAFDPV